MTNPNLVRPQARRGAFLQVLGQVHVYVLKHQPQTHLIPTAAPVYHI